jgi:PhzF family phenazine biosynthesis protein
VDSAAEVLLVDACLRAGTGGSPTAVADDHDGLQDSDLMRIPSLAGTSHVAVIGRCVGRGDRRAVRFFTSQGELPGCGHGTVAAIAALSYRSGHARFEGRLRVGGRDFDASGGYDSSGLVVEAWFDQGLVEHRAAGGTIYPFLAALGLGLEDLHPDDQPAIASPGRPRLLLPVADEATLAALRPNQERLAFESRRHGLLGSFVYTPPSPARRSSARMFAPTIGVPEDVANANSAGCLAAHQLVMGREPALAVDQGDVLGRPSTVYADALRTSEGIGARVGGTARIVGTFPITV